MSTVEDAPPAPEAPSSRGDVIRKMWMFCPITGSLLILDAAQGVARSRYCEFARPLADLDDTMSVGEPAGGGGFLQRGPTAPIVNICRRGGMQLKVCASAGGLVVRFTPARARACKHACQRGAALLCPLWLSTSVRCSAFSCCKH